MLLVYLEAKHVEQQEHLKRVTVQEVTSISACFSCLEIFLKRPVRDVCLYMGEATPTDPHFLFAVASQS